MIDDFQRQVWEFYDDYGRHELPWRQTTDPYPIMASEVMLQQTQVARVIPKYQEFLRRFPTVRSLAEAPLADVLRAWNGLGYNRRAKFLHQAAQQITDTFPSNVPELIKLPGIGPNTAGAILAYAFDQPVIFIETNIRTVFIHHFFLGQTDITDQAILRLVEQTLDQGRPREWYWALMDYGSHLKQTVGNLNRRGSSYAKQSAFHGSRRQLRGQIIRSLVGRSHDFNELQRLVKDARLNDVLRELTAEKLIIKRGRQFSL
jgi:A/G-specific adenine glycosylase